MLGSFAGPILSSGTRTGEAEASVESTRLCARPELGYRDSADGSAPAAAGLSRSDPNLAIAFHHAPMGVVVAQPDGVIIACNPAAGQLLDRDPSDLSDGDVFAVVHPDDRADAQRHCARLLAGGTAVLRHECRLRLRGGRTIWVSMSISPVPQCRVRPDRLVIHIEDITERKRRESELSHQALHDPLTGLANRVLLIERIRQAMSGSRHAHPSHLFYLDLNGFKEVNDRFGHAAGDAVLTEFAPRIAALLRAGDTAARLGGDEFAVLCEDTEPRHVSTIAERLRAAAAEPFLIDDAEIILSVAVGSSPAYASPTYIADPAALLGEADRRMYETKQRTISVPVPAPRGAALTSRGPGDQVTDYRSRSWAGRRRNTGRVASRGVS
jgi:diguanylate cyclase (GGDEF)-like protein/PAS domain S-box-containing protein